jgi:hypothetical protein
MTPDQTQQIKDLAFRMLQIAHLRDEEAYLQLCRDMPDGAYEPDAPIELTNLTIIMDDVFASLRFNINRKRREAAEKERQEALSDYDQFRKNKELGIATEIGGTEQWGAYKGLPVPFTR